MDFLGLAARTGFRRREFAARIEELASETEAKHGPRSSVTDDGWADVVDKVQKAAAEQYTKDP